MFSMRIESRVWDRLRPLARLFLSRALNFLKGLARCPFWNQPLIPFFLLSNS